MKKLMFALVTAALLHAPAAKATYIGTFTAGSSYSFEVIAGAGVETGDRVRATARSLHVHALKPNEPEKI